jgi:hypothetical protein
MSFGNTLVAGLIFATLAVLVTGVALMSLGGKANAKYGNRLMVARVTLQGLVILLIMLLFAAGGE